MSHAQRARALGRIWSHMAVMRGPNGKLLPGSQLTRSTISFRKAIQLATSDGAEIVDILLELARGSAWRPKLPPDADGKVKEGPPVVPTSEIRLRAAQELADRLWGRTVPETDIVKAQAATAALATLSDEELERRARAALAAKQAKAERDITPPKIALPVGTSEQSQEDSDESD